MRNRFILHTGAAVTAAMMLAACGDSGGETTPGDSNSGSELIPITIGQASETAAYGDLYVCEDEGIFEKHGLDVTISTLSTSSQLLAALASGSVQVGGGTAAALAAGAMEGIDLNFVALKIPVYALEMWGKSDIEDIQDMAGRKVAVSSPGSLSSDATLQMLEDKGLLDDVTVVNVKGVSESLAALDAGSVDAMVAAPPQTAETGRRGFHKIYDYTEYETAGGVYATMGDYAEESPEAVGAFVKAEAECLSILHSDPEASVAAIQKHTGISDPELAEYAYEFYEPIWTREPTVDQDLIDTAFEEAAAKSGATVPSDTSEFVNNTFAEELTESGFIDELYGE